MINILHAEKFLHDFLLSTDFFSKMTFIKNYFLNTIRRSNSLDTDQAQSVQPGLGLNCLQRLSTDDTSRQRVSWACI